MTELSRRQFVGVSVLTLLAKGLHEAVPKATARSDGQSRDLPGMATVRLDAMTDLAVTCWKWHGDNLPHPEDPALNVSDWQNFKLLQRPNSSRRLREAVVGRGPVRFRTRIVIPKAMGGYRIVGCGSS